MCQPTNKTCKTSMQARRRCYEIPKSIYLLNELIFFHQSTAESCVNSFEQAWCLLTAMSSVLTKLLYRSGKNAKLESSWRCPRIFCTNYEKFQRFRNSEQWSVMQCRLDTSFMFSMDLPNCVLIQFGPINNALQLFFWIMLKINTQKLSCKKWFRLFRRIPQFQSWENLVTENTSRYFLPPGFLMDQIVTSIILCLLFPFFFRAIFKKKAIYGK